MIASALLTKNSGMPGTRFYVTGVRGQLGTALVRRIPKGMWEGCDLPEIDVADASAIRDAIRAASPAVVIHCAAWTEVDGCARDPGKAHRVNAQGSRHVALAALEVGASHVQVSTNEVFDGWKWEPYVETDRTHPINAYGQSKREGEVLAMHANPRCWVVRTSWLYGRGGRNFIHRVQHLADEKGSLRVVTDEIASPTCVEDLAEAILLLVERASHGIYHLVNRGGCSRWELAKAVMELTGRGHVPVEPIKLADWPRPSTPPSYSVLDGSKAAGYGIVLAPWRDALEAFLR